MGVSLIKFYSAIVHTVNAVSRCFGNQFSPTEATGENATNGKAQIYTVSVPATSYALIWNGQETGAIRDWTALALKATDATDGTLELYWLVDTPTSEDDLTASGSNPKGLPDSMSCKATKVFDNARVYMSTTNNTTLGATAGVPTLVSGTYSLFKRYRLYARNRAAAAVDVEVGIFD